MNLYFVDLGLNLFDSGKNTVIFIFHICFLNASFTSDIYILMI